VRPAGRLDIPSGAHNRPAGGRVGNRQVAQLRNEIDKPRPRRWHFSARPVGIVHVGRRRKERSLQRHAGGMAAWQDLDRCVPVCAAQPSVAEIKERPSEREEARRDYRGGRVRFDGRGPRATHEERPAAVIGGRVCERANLACCPFREVEKMGVVSDNTNKRCSSRPSSSSRVLVVRAAGRAGEFASPVAGGTSLSHFFTSTAAAAARSGPACPRWAEPGRRRSADRSPLRLLKCRRIKWIWRRVAKESGDTLKRARRKRRRDD
jgi:hypothetical protein